MCSCLSRFYSQDDLDLVTYLPPFGTSVGDKLWLVSDGDKEEVYMLPREWLENKCAISEFSESVWLNLRIFESLRKQHMTHRVVSYAQKLKKIMSNEP